MFVRWKKTPLARGWIRSAPDYEVGCRHPHGPDSVRLAPILVESYRPEGGTPKHRTVWSPAISVRQCCVKDRESLERIDFWVSFEWQWERAVKASAQRVQRKEILAFQHDIFVNSKAKIWDAIARVVPHLTPEEWDLGRYCTVREVFRDKRDSLEHDHEMFRQAAARRDEWYANRKPGESYRQYRDRRDQEAQARRTQASNQNASGASALSWLIREITSSPCWGVLGLSWPTTATAVSKAYKTLVFKNHPDRGGTDQGVIRATEAKNNALKFIDRYEALTGRKAG